MKNLTDLRVTEDQAPVSIAEIRAEAKRLGASYLCVCASDLEANPPPGYVLPSEVYLGWENEDALWSMEDQLSAGGFVILREVV